MADTSGCYRHNQELFPPTATLTLCQRPGTIALPPIESTLSGQDVRTVGRLNAVRLTGAQEQSEKSLQRPPERTRETEEHSNRVLMEYQLESRAQTNT